jgi:hypothetical protein
MGGSSKPPAPTAEERALQKAQADLLNEQRDIVRAQREQQKVLLPFLADQEGYDITLDDDGNIKTIGKRYNRAEDLRNQLDEGLAERSLKALKGELDVDPALEDALKEQETNLRERLKHQFGAGYETSTPGVDALGEFGKNAEMLRAGARRGELTLSEQLGIARSQQNQSERMTSQDYLRQIGPGDAMSYAGAFGQIASGYGAAQGPYIAQRQMQMQAQQSKRSGIMGLIGAGVGAAGSILSTPAAGAFMFSDERLKSNAQRIGVHKRLGVPIYKFTIDGEERIGVFAGDVQNVKPELVTSRMGYRVVEYGGL